jgi:hypothetical protein
MVGAMQSSRRDGLNPKPWLGLALALLAGAAACSVEPLMPGPMGGSNDGGAGQGGNAGTTGVAGTTGTGGGGAVDGGPACGPTPSPPPCLVGQRLSSCTLDASGRWIWATWCPDEMTGNGGAAGGGAAGAGGGGTGGAPCPSTSSCANDEVCTTEDGVCHAPPGCGPGAACPAICYGNCRPVAQGPACGSTRCAVGMVCCNSSCGICTSPNGGCTQQFCGTTPPGGGVACTTDVECRVEADYCTGCDCRALAPNQSLPPCTGPGVRCLADPCMGKAARCVNGQCAAQ